MAKMGARVPNERLSTSRLIHEIGSDLTFMQSEKKSVR